MIRYFLGLFLLSYFFMAFALALAGGAIYSNRKVIKMVDKILTELPLNLLNHLQTTKPAVYDLLFQIANKKVAALTNFTTTLATMPTTRIADFYNGLSATLKPKFFQDFGVLGTNVLNKLYNLQVLNNWKKLGEINSAERKLFDVIGTTKRTDTLVQFYGNAQLRLKIEVLDIKNKIKFIDNVGIVSENLLVKCKTVCNNYIK